MNLVGKQKMLFDFIKEMGGRGANVMDCRVVYTRPESLSLNLSILAQKGLIVERMGRFYLNDKKLLEAKKEAQKAFLEA